MGEKGQDREYELRLKMIADIGFIGYPNAGKSTLLAAVTRAFPKIAPYPFTTLRPYIGLAKFLDNSNLIFADLPGIIEGASENKGLGHRFLAHAERTKAILYVVDGLGNRLENEKEGISELKAMNKSPIEDYRILFNELKEYKQGMLLDKPSLIALNKMDMTDDYFLEQYEILKQEAHAPVVPISAKDGTNLEVLVETLKNMAEE